MSSPVLTVESLAVQLLQSVTLRPSERGSETAPDWGIPLLAHLLTETTPAARHDEPARSAVLTWVSRHGRGARTPGVYAGGLAGCAIGLAHAAKVEPRLEPAARAAALRVADWGSGFRWEHLPGPGLAARDYDLISGMAGVTAALASLTPDSPAELAAIAGLVRLLAELCDSDDLARSRIGNDAGIELSEWQVGTVNLGLAHGVPGVLAALVAAWPLLVDEDRAAAAPAIRRIATALVRQTCRYGEVTGWPFAVGPGDSRPMSGWPSSEIQRRRQAWCYGTPGVAWQLAEAGRVLEDDDLRDAGVAAMSSLCASWDDDYHLHIGPRTDQLTFCHGAAGVVAIGDAFALHFGLQPAGRLADHLAGLLAQSLSEVADFARQDLSTLSGATGILATLLSRNPRQRGWLSVVGLR